MGAVAFDTHEFIKTLKQTGLSEEQAEAISVGVRNSHEAAELATKADLRELESRLDAKHEALRHEIGAVRTEMTSMKWVLGFLAAGIIALLVKTFF